MGAKSRSKQSFVSAVEMAEAIEGEEFASEVQAQLRRTQIAAALHMFRVAKGVSQAEVAQAIGCSPSRVSRIEKGYDEDLRIRDIQGYAQALDCEIHLTLFPRRMTLVDRIKYHGVAIAQILQRLAQLARSDSTIAQGVARFFRESCYNLVRFVKDAAEQLPREPETDRPLLTIELAEETLTNLEPLQTDGRDPACPEQEQEQETPDPLSSVS